jgi:DNA-binding response OmpR family regulator
MKRILVIEDDPAIQKGLKISLESENYEVLSSNDGQKGYELAKKEKADLIILDIMLPNKNGIDICKDLRQEGIFMPILMLTSKKSELDKVLGLEIGADDYVTKPFSIRELSARIKALLRRGQIEIPEPDEFNFGKIHVNFKKQEAGKDGSILQFTTKEYEILKFFAKHIGEPISREMLLNEVWGYDAYPTTRTIDNYILALRKKVEDDPAHPVHILTIHTTGYKFVK